MTTATLPSSVIVEKADAELNTIAEEQANAQSLIGTAQEEVRGTETRLQTLQDERASLEQAVEHAQADVSQAQTYAHLAAATPSEATAVARLAADKKAEREASRALAKFVTSHGNEQTALPLRIADLQARMIQAEERLSELAHKEQALNTARNQAWQSLGEETFDAALASVKAAETAANERAAALVEARLALREVRETAELQLRPWADLHRRAITEHALLEDATVRVLRSYLAFLETLASDAPLMASQINGFSPAMQVETTGGFVESIMRRTLGVEKQIESRRSGAQQLLHMYLTGR